MLDAHLADDFCETIPGYGNDSVVEAISLVESRGIPDVAALIDRDWGKSRRPISGLAARTDFYDIDATIFFSGDVCKRVVGAFCDRSKVARFLSDKQFQSVIDAAVALAFPLGVLRSLSHSKGWGLRVAGLPIE